MKALSVAKLKKAVKDMRPGILLVRKADNHVMAYWNNGQKYLHCLDMDYDQYMIYWKKVPQ